MIYKLDNKRIILLLTISLMIILSILWHKKETTNNIVPKKASYVLNEVDWGNVNA